MDCLSTCCIVTIIIAMSILLFTYCGGEEEQADRANVRVWVVDLLTTVLKEVIKAMFKKQLLGEC